jgi:hypothetical protein
MGSESSARDIDFGEKREDRIELNGLEEFFTENHEELFSKGLSIKQAVFYYGETRRSLKAKVEEGEIPAIRLPESLGRKWRIFPDGVPQQLADYVPKKLRKAKAKKQVAEDDRNVPGTLLREDYARPSLALTDFEDLLSEISPPEVDAAAPQTFIAEPAAEIVESSLAGSSKELDPLAAMPKPRLRPARSASQKTKQTSARLTTPPLESSIPLIIAGPPAQLIIEEAIAPSQTEDTVTIMQTEEPIALTHIEASFSALQTAEPVAITQAEDPVAAIQSEEPVAIIQSEEPVAIAQREEPVAITQIEEPPLLIEPELPSVQIETEQAPVMIAQTESETKSARYTVIQDRVNELEKKLSDAIYRSNYLETRISGLEDQIKFLTQQNYQSRALNKLLWLLPAAVAIIAFVALKMAPL